MNKNIKGILVLVSTVLVSLFVLSKVNGYFSMNEVKKAKEELLKEIDNDEKILNENKDVIASVKRNVKVKINPNSLDKEIIIRRTDGKPFYVQRDGSASLEKFSEFKISRDTYDFEDRLLSDNQGSVFEIFGYNKKPGWTDKINDNKFEGNIEIYKENGELVFINHLTLEEYLRGMAEVPENDNNEKRKALSVAIRSYVDYYTNGKGELKFPGKKYNASDDPKVFQKYLGYGYSERSPNWQKALKETEGEKIYYNDEVLRTPFYSCTLAKNGKTLTPKEAKWGKYFLDRIEVFQNVEDSIGVDPNRNTRALCGHGVGMSGYGATKLGEQGKTYKEILNHYYQNVEIK